MKGKRKGEGGGRRPGGAARKKDWAKEEGRTGSKGKASGASDRNGPAEVDRRRTMAKILAVVVAVVVIAAALGWFLLRTDNSGKDGNGVDRSIQFPRDEGAHDEPFEFWNVAFLVTSGDGKRFGISATFSKYSKDMGGDNTSQLLITDEYNATGHPYSSKKTWGELAAEEGRLNLSYVAESGFEKEYLRQLEGFNYVYHGEMYRSGSKIAAIDLNIEHYKPPILIGTNGKIFDPKLNIGTIFGYSQTRLSVHGSIALEGKNFNVEGFAWIDHQWGAWSYSRNEYWQLQMENGDDLAISRLYNYTGIAYKYFYRVGPSGEATAVDEYEFGELKYLVAPSNPKNCVSSKWMLRSSSIDLTAEFAVQYQFSAPLVWEGTIGGSGTMDGSLTSGRGYAMILNAQTTDPKISNVTHRYFDPGATTPVTANITDGIPIVNATIYYNTSKNSTIKSVPMTFVSGYKWSGELPPQPYTPPDYVIVYYYIVAFDLADNSATSATYEFDVT